MGRQHLFYDTCAVRQFVFVEPRSEGKRDFFFAECRGNIGFGYRLDALVGYPPNDGLFAQRKRNDFSVLIVRTVQDVDFHIEEKPLLRRA